MKLKESIQSIGEFVKDSLTLFGIEVNTKRQLPSFDDGLKPSYRHIIYEELKTGDNFRKSVDIAGSCMSTTHGHGDQSLKGPIDNLVRWGISTGRGNHGKKLLYGEDSVPASMRYTEAKISKKYFNIFSPFMPYVPWIESEVKGMEPEYLPTPVPLCLTFGTLGIGLGVNCRIPAFTVESLLNAYVQNNPDLLEAPFGMIIDKSKSELVSLWETGVGKICYKFNVDEKWIGGSFGYEISGNPELFKPNLSKIERWQSSGKVFILDTSANGLSSIFIAREYNIKSLTHEEIKEAVDEVSGNTRTYRLTVAKDNTAFLIPLYSWLDHTFTQYLGIMENYKESNIEKLKFDYEVWKWLPEVAKTLYENPELNAEQVSNKLGINNTDVVKTIFDKSINTLRRAENSGKLEKILAKIEEFKAINTSKKVIEMVNEF